MEITMKDKVTMIYEELKTTAREGVARRRLAFWERELRRAEANAAKHPTPWCKAKVVEKQGMRDFFVKKYTLNPLAKCSDLPLRATLLCCIRSHCRNKIHMHWWKKHTPGQACEILTLDNQRDFVLSHLDHMDKWEAQHSKWYTPTLNKEFRTMARELITSTPPARERAA